LFDFVDGAHLTRVMKKLSLLSIELFLGLLIAVQVHAAPVKTPAELIGTWSLESFVIIDKGGKETPWCEGLSGLLTYTKDGYMSAAINCKSATNTSPAHAYHDRLFYSGFYTVAAGPVLTHHVMNGSENNLIGTELIRRVAKLDKDHLVLTGDFGGNFSIAWTKAPVQK
jgi:hypothetical protein